MKKFLLILLFIFTFPGLSVFAGEFYGYDIPVNISINENIIETENTATLIRGVSYAPVRFIANAMNIRDVLWNEKERSVTITADNKILKLFADKNYGYLNEEKINIKNNAVLKNSRLLVPVRFISEVFNCDVTWDKTLYLANIENPHITVPSDMIEKDYSKNDLIWLTRLIEAESAGEPFNGKIAVGNVVLNRVESNDFPNTIYDVIFDKKYGVQFQPIENNAILNTPSQDSIIAGNIALTNKNVAGESLYFLNPKIATSNWIIKNRIYYKTIHNHDFYL